MGVEVGERWGRGGGRGGVRGGCGHHTARCGPQRSSALSASAPHHGAALVRAQPSAPLRSAAAWSASRSASQSTGSRLCGRRRGWHHRVMVVMVATPWRRRRRREDGGDGGDEDGGDKDCGAADQRLEEDEKDEEDERGGGGRAAPTAPACTSNAQVSSDDGPRARNTGPRSGPRDGRRLGRGWVRCSRAGGERGLRWVLGPVAEPAMGPWTHMLWECRAGTACASASRGGGTPVLIRRQRVRLTGSKILAVIAGRQG